MVSQFGNLKFWDVVIQFLLRARVREKDSSDRFKKIAVLEGKIMIFPKLISTTKITNKEKLTPAPTPLYTYICICIYIYIYYIYLLTDHYSPTKKKTAAHFGGPCLHRLWPLKFPEKIDSS